MKNFFKKIAGVDANKNNRNKWLINTLSAIPSNNRILDAGAGELQNKPLCQHLEYVSQDICQYEGTGDKQGLQMGKWDTSKIDLVCDIVAIPEPDASFDVILCSEVLEHLPDPLRAIDEFARLLKPGGQLILTAPFASLVHFAPYHYASGFSRYWYEYHLPLRRFQIKTLVANGDWFTLLRQEVLRLPGMSRRNNDWLWPTAWLVAGLGWLYFVLRGTSRSTADVACFGWHCVAVRQHGDNDVFS